MTITQIETNITKLLKDFTQDNFIFDFLLAYGEPKATISRLKKGELNQLKSKGEVLLRKKVFFKEVHEHLHGSIDTLKNEYDSQKQKPRFIIVTDYKILLGFDTKTTDTLDIDFKELVKHFDFFLPLAGMEKSTHVDENPADVRASNKLAKLYDEILKENPTSTHAEVHALSNTLALWIITSSMHMVWIKAVRGKLKTDYRYSTAIIYNTFLFPNILEKQKEEITELVFNILDEREQHSEKILAQLYNTDKMPVGLKEAHHQLDLAIERCYRKKPFESDEEILEYLFKLYEEMIKAEGK